MAKATYTPKQREAALALYVEHGPAEASRRTGIARGTISQWARRTGVTDTRSSKTRAATEAAAASRILKRELLKDEMLDRLRDLVKRMEEPAEDFVGKDGDHVEFKRAPAKDCRDLGVTTGILTEKFLLLEGEATSREERVTQTEFDREVADLVSTMKKRANGSRRAKSPV